MADDEDVLVAAALVEEFLEVLQGGFGGEAVGEQDLGFVAGLGADEGGGLQAAFERAGDDEVELDFRALRTWASCRQWRLPSLSRGRFRSRRGFVRRIPALAWRRMKRFIVSSHSSPDMFLGDWL